MDNSQHSSNKIVSFSADNQELNNLLPENIISEFNKIKNKILNFNKTEKEGEDIYTFIKQLMNEDEYKKFEGERKQLYIDQKKKEILLKEFEIKIKSDPPTETKENLFNEFKNSINEINSKKDKELLKFEDMIDMIADTLKTEASID